MKKHYIEDHPDKYKEKYPAMICIGCFKLFPRKSLKDSHLKSCHDYQLHLQKNPPLIPQADFTPTLKHVKPPTLDAIHPLT